MRAPAEHVVVGTVEMDPVVRKVSFHILFFLGTKTRNNTKNSKELSCPTYEITKTNYPQENCGVIGNLTGLSRQKFLCLVNLHILIFSV